MEEKEGTQRTHDEQKVEQGNQNNSNDQQSGDPQPPRRYRKKSKLITDLLAQADKEGSKKMSIKVDRKTLAKAQFLGLDIQILFEALCEEFFDRKDVREKLKKINDEDQTE